MNSPLEWKADESVAVGKGATLQQFVAMLGTWGEGHLKVNGREIARIDYPKD